MLKKGIPQKCVHVFFCFFKKNFRKEFLFSFLDWSVEKTCFFDLVLDSFSPLCLVGEDERAAGDAETRACQAEGFRQQHAGPSPGATGGHVRGQQADRGQVPQHQRSHEEKGNGSFILFLFPCSWDLSDPSLVMFYNTKGVMRKRITVHPFCFYLLALGMC